MRSAPIIHVLADLYFACVDHHMQQLFLALLAIMNY